MNKIGLICPNPTIEQIFMDLLYKKLPKKVVDTQICTAVLNPNQLAEANGRPEAMKILLKTVAQDLIINHGVTDLALAHNGLYPYTQPVGSVEFINPVQIIADEEHNRKLVRSLLLTTKALMQNSYVTEAFNKLSLVLPREDHIDDVNKIAIRIPMYVAPARDLDYIINTVQEKIYIDSILSVCTRLDQLLTQIPRNSNICVLTSTDTLVNRISDLITMDELEPISNAGRTIKPIK